MSGMVNLIKRKCLNCGKEFETNRETKLYCSDDCYHSYYRKHRKKVYHSKCQVCGKEFESIYSTKKCCSHACACKLVSMKKKKKKTSRKVAPEAMVKEYERMKRNGVPVTSRKVDGMVVESRGQHCWSCGLSLARSIY